MVFIEKSSGQTVEGELPIELTAEETASKPDLHDSIRIPFAALGTVGTVFSALVSSAPTASSEVLYRAVTADGTPMRLCYACKNGIGFSSGYLSNGAVASAHFEEAPVFSATRKAIDPAMLFMVIALCRIEKRFDAIEKVQLNILEFLEEEKSADLAGNLQFLTELLENYRFHWENETYCTSMYAKVQDIHQTATQNVLFYQGRVEKALQPTKMIETDRAVATWLKMVTTALECYRRALYLVGFTSFLEILLLKNFDAAFLKSAEERLSKDMLAYMELYTACYDRLESASKRSVINTFLGCAGSVSETAGKIIEKLPVVSKSQLDENLIRRGRNWKADADHRTERKALELTASRDTGITTFIESIRTLDQTYNGQSEFLIGKDSLYVRTIA